MENCTLNHLNCSSRKSDKTKDFLIFHYFVIQNNIFFYFMFLPKYAAFKGCHCQHTGVSVLNLLRNVYFEQILICIIIV